MNELTFDFLPVIRLHVAQLTFPVFYCFLCDLGVSAVNNPGWRDIMACDIRRLRIRPPQVWRVSELQPAEAWFA